LDQAVSQSAVDKLGGMFLTVPAAFSEFKVDQVAFRTKIREDGGIAVAAFVGSGNTFFFGF